MGDFLPVNSLRLCWNNDFNSCYAPVFRLSRSLGAMYTGEKAGA